MVEELDNFFLISFFVFNALFIDFSDSKQTHLRRINWNLTIRIKEPSSSVHLPSSTTGCLFLLAHCHYKALQGDVSHRGRPGVSWHSPEFRHPDTQSHAEETHIYSECSICEGMEHADRHTPEVRGQTVKETPTTKNILLGSLHNSAPGTAGAWRGLVYGFRSGTDTLWDESMNSVTWLRRDNGVWKCSRCSAHLFMFSSLNNKQNLQFCILTPGTIPLPIPFKIYNIYHIRVYKI